MPPIGYTGVMELWTGDEQFTVTIDRYGNKTVIHK